MRIGPMDDKIVIERREPAGKSASGEDIYAWVQFHACSAEFIPDRGQEIFRSHQRQGQSNGLFRIRHFAGIVPAMRVVCEGRHYDISSVVPMWGRKTGIELFVTEGLTNG